MGDGGGKADGTGAVVGELPQYAEVLPLDTATIGLQLVLSDSMIHL